MKPSAPQKKYREFRFKKYEYTFDAPAQKLLVELQYSFDGEVNFTERLEFPVDEATWGAADQAALDRAVSALHIMGGISYFKSYLPPAIVGLKLDAGQAAFWNKVYESGLGEFFYRNEIDFRGLINFPVTETEPGGNVGPTNTPLPERSLVPIGGGKDSLVTAELMREAGMDFTLFSLRDAGPIADTSAVVGRPRIVVERAIDPQLFALNEAGALNGHVPITAYISFVTAVCAVLYGYKYLVFSLEKSANYGQILFHGMDVNHQFSKSEEFEAAFRDYMTKYIVGGIEYFSFLRPLNELKIAQMFAALPNFEQFAGLFTSCNANFTIHERKSPVLWCGHCPKCAFVFLILAPFVERQKLLEIFGQNLLDREDLLPLFEELLGLKNFKPFECVGTPEESRVALHLISQKSEYADDLLIQQFHERYIDKWDGLDFSREVEQALAIQSQSFLPVQFWQILKQYA